MVDCLSDFKMPEKLVSRLLKESLPDNVSISKDFKSAACRSASVFILHMSIAAAEKAQENDRSSLDNQDIIKAVTDLGLGEYAPQLVRFGAQRKRNAKRKEGFSQKGKSQKKSSSIPSIDQEEPTCESVEHMNESDAYLEETHQSHLESTHDELEMDHNQPPSEGQDEMMED